MTRGEIEIHHVKNSHILSRLEMLRYYIGAADTMLSSCHLLRLTTLLVLALMLRLRL